MMRRDYFSVRSGKLSVTQDLSFKMLKKLFVVVYEKLVRDGYFQKYFGYDCVDEGEVSGELGSDVTAMVFFNLKKEHLWPIHSKIEEYDESDIFDMIEFLHDHCSKPISGYYHQFNNCGYHYSTFDDQSGQALFREKINYLLKDYKEGFELSENGEILELPDSNIAPLLQATIPTDDTQNVSNKIESAVRKFRRQKSTFDERRDALRELADVLEYLRPEIKNVILSKDESDLFNIANNFGIRHHNKDQKTEYDKAIW